MCAVYNTFPFPPAAYHMPNVTSRGRSQSDCFTTDPILMGMVSVFGGVPALYLARSLRNVYDPFGIRQELELVMWTGIVCGGDTLIIYGDFPPALL